MQRSAEEKAEFERHGWSANNDNDIRAVCVARRVPRVVISTQRGGSGELGCIIWLVAEPLCDARGTRTCRDSDVTGAGLDVRLRRMTK